MHEVELVSAAVTQALAATERSGARRIQQLNFALRRGSHVTPEVVETLVAILGRDTLAEGAVVAFESTDDMASDLALVSIDVEPAEDAPDTQQVPAGPHSGHLSR
jgi:hypothetical protein